MPVNDRRAVEGLAVGYAKPHDGACARSAFAAPGAHALPGRGLSFSRKSVQKGILPAGIARDNRIGSILYQGPGVAERQNASGTGVSRRW
jgi:hypothetical protein